MLPFKDHVTTFLTYSDFFYLLTVASEQPQTHALDRASTGIGMLVYIGTLKYLKCKTSKIDNRYVDSYDL
jgi:hypothetical protein